MQRYKLIVAAKHGKPPKMDGVESYHLSFCVFVHILDFYFLWAPFFLTIKSSLLFLAMSLFSDAKLDFQRPHTF